VSFIPGRRLTFVANSASGPGQQVAFVRVVPDLLHYGRRRRERIL